MQRFIKGFNAGLRATEQPMNVECPHCGGKNPYTAVQCQHCGKRIAIAERPKQQDNPFALLGCLAVAIVCAFLVYTCSTQEGGDTEPSDAQYQIAALANVESLLRDPNNADFRNLKVHHHDEIEPGLVVLCGEVNSTNGFGGKSGYQRFISGGVAVLEEQMDPSEFAQSWATFCL